MHGLSQHEENEINVLIVEDQTFMRQMLRECLQSAYPDAVIMEAADGARALELCGSDSPQLVLMDVSLPDANGIDVTARIKAMLPGTAVIIVSQHAGHAYVERAQAAGAFAYITKDAVYRELLPTVSRALRREQSTGVRSCIDAFTPMQDLTPLLAFPESSQTSDRKKPSP